MDMDAKNHQKPCRTRRLQNILSDSESRRSRRKSTRKWKIGEELIILEYFRNIIRQKQEIEKPTPEVFYAKLIEDLRLKDVSPTETKDKVRHLRDSYIRALKWIQRTDQNPNRSWVRQCLLQICRHYDILAEIYGNKLETLHQKHYLDGKYAVSDDDEDDSTDYSDNSHLPSKRQSPPSVEEDPLPETSSKTEGLYDGSLHSFKQFLTTTSEAINRAFPSPASSTWSEIPSQLHQQRKRPFITTETEMHFSYQEKWKMEEIRIQHEKIQLEKLKQEWEKDIKESELYTRRLEIESNERLRTLEIEKEERIEKFKIEQECKLQLELASIKNASSS